MRVDGWKKKLASVTLRKTHSNVTEVSAANRITPMAS